MFAAKKREDINHTLRRVISWSGGFSDECLLDACDATLEELRITNPRRLYGKRGILDPCSIRNQDPPPLRAIHKLNYERFEQLVESSDCNWRNVLQAVIEDAVSDMSIQDELREQEKAELGHQVDDDDPFECDIDSRLQEYTSLLSKRIMTCIPTRLGDLPPPKRCKTEL